jgi:hypothetical protein
MESSYIFVHNEWTDTCIINNITSDIRRKILFNETGKCLKENDKIIIKWNNWKGEDIFIKYNDFYIYKIFYDTHIKSNNIIEINIIHLEWESICFYNKNIIFSKNNIKSIGTYLFNNDKTILTIKWNNLIYDTFIKIENNYYDEKYILKLVKLNEIFHDNQNNKKEKYIKINNRYYLNNIQKYNYKLFDIPDLVLNHKLDRLTNPYINISNIKSHINNTKDNISLFTNLLNIEIDFCITKKNKKRCLSLVEWGYPPFGGGENWLLNFNKMLYNNNYETFLICFSDPFIKKSFKKINLIDLDYIKIIQMPFDILTIIKFIKIIEPDIINHQGINRLLFMKISNILNIPFLTGFCFWNDIIKFNSDNININMLNNNNLERTDDFNFIIENSYTYVSSQFVNDVIYKLYNINLDIIETISLKDDYYINNENTAKYVTLINCHYNKGGFLIKYLCENLDISIPLIFIYTEYDHNISLELLNELINNRNKINNINILISEKVDIKPIYKKTKILLIPSLCDETFCRVAYEGMNNKIPIISNTTGNLKYLLKDYAIFIDSNDAKEWKINIEKLYYDSKEFLNINDLNENIISQKIITKLESISESKYKLCEKNIGLIFPWADQGLGIQGREYYLILERLGYIPNVLSFKPYHSTNENIYLQKNSLEWDYKNITYSNNYREDLTYDEILNFVYKNNIKKVIIIEATFNHIFKIALFLKILNIKIYLIVNIECIRLEELTYHNIFDKILTNNNETYNILSNIFKNKVEHLGFNLEHSYFNNIKKNKYNNEKLKFCCIGGLNSISRKNIDLIIITFYNIFIENIYLDWELNVYIQGIQIPDIINKYKCNNINYYVEHLPYKTIIEKYINNNIFIHMGSHEGLGLGFYEALYCGTPILTMNWTPNNEIIYNNINGWIINCVSTDINDNNNSLINRGIINETDLKNKIIEIINDKSNTYNIINMTIESVEYLKKKNKYVFEQKLIKALC